jgi:hypothetical protein
MTVPAFWVVEHLDVVKDIVPGNYRDRLTVESHTPLLGSRPTQ